MSFGAFQPHVVCFQLPELQTGPRFDHFEPTAVMENNVEELHFKAVRSSRCFFVVLFCTATSFSLLCGKREVGVKAVSRPPTPLSPVRVRADLHHGRPLSVQHLQGVGQVEEVKLHVDGSWRILPGVEGLRAILQHHLLWGGSKGQWVTDPPRLKQNV